MATKSTSTFDEQCKRRSIPRSAIAACALLQLASVPVWSAPTLYKWIDEDGQVRYSDSLPAEQKKKRHQILSPQGHLLDTQEAAIPPEELARMREEQQRQEEEAKRKAEEEARVRALQEHHDNVLLMTFSNEEEIVEAQQERLDVIQSVIRLLRKNIEIEQQKLEKLEERAQTIYLDKDQAVPGGLAQNIEYFQEKILGIQQQIALKLEERDRLKAQNATDLLRYRELIQAKRQEEAAKQAEQEAKRR